MKHNLGSVQDRFSMLNNLKVYCAVQLKSGLAESCLKKLSYRVSFMIVEHMGLEVGVAVLSAEFFSTR